MVIDPLLVTISAVYCLLGSMHMGGGPSNFCFFGLEPSAAGPSVAMGQDSLMVTAVIMWTTLGAPCGEPSASIFLATSTPSVTWPNSEYCGGRLVPWSPTMMKNWLPLVLAPELAMASEPTLYCPACGSSSWN